MNHNFFLSNENLVGASESSPLLSLNNCLVVPGTGSDSSDAASIAEESGDIIIETCNENLLWNDGCIHRSKSPLGYGPEALKRGLSLQRVVRSRLNESRDKLEVSEPAIFLGHAFGWYAFGHLHDTFQRLFYCEDIIQDPRIGLIVNRYDRVVDFMQHLRALTGRDFSSEKITILRKNDPLRHYDELFYPHAPAVLTSYTEQSLEWVRMKYFNYFKTTDKKPSRLYLSRNHVRPGSRGVINEREVIDLLEERGFTVLYGTESLSLIVDLFSRAEIVLGNHGSLLAHSYLCPDNCVIHEFCPKTRVDITFKQKLKVAKVYYQHLVESDHMHNINICIKFLEEIV